MSVGDRFSRLPIMSCSVRQDDITIIICGSSYDSLDEDALEECGGLMLTESSHIEPPLMVLDMTETEFIGSTFIELMLRSWKRLKERGGSMAICGANPFCVEVLQITRLTTLWKIYPNRQDAVVALKSC